MTMIPVTARGTADPYSARVRGVPFSVLGSQIFVGIGLYVTREKLFYRFTHYTVFT